MTKICIRCEKQFKSEHNLNQHLNKKMQCGTSLKCDRCNKVFYIQRDYDQHMARKFKCNLSEDKSQLELKKIDLEIQKTNAKLEIEKSRSLRSELKLKAIESRINLQAEKAKELLQMKSDLALLSIAERQKNTTAVENMKSERKERTAVQINITETNNYHNTNITYLSEKYLPNNEMTISQKDVENFILNKIENIYTRKRAIKLYNTSESINDINNTILVTLLNNEKLPQLRSFFFKKEKEQFYGIKLSLEDTKEIQKIDYTLDIDPIIKSILARVYNILINSIPAPSIDKFFTASQQKYNSLIDHNSVLPKLNGNLLTCAKHSFDEENTLVKI